MKAEEEATDSRAVLSASLYLEGVLPALSAFLQTSPAPLPRPVSGCIYFRGPQGLAGLWPEAAAVPGTSSLSRAGLTLQFYSATQITALFEKGRGFFLPMGGLTHLGLLRAFQRTGSAFQSAIQEPEVSPEVLQIQLNLLLRLSCLLFAREPGLRRRVGNLPQGYVSIRIGEGSGAESWFGFQENEGLIWGEGRPPESPRGILEIPNRETAREIFAGKLIGEEAVSSGRVRMRGNIPFIQAVNLVFESLDRYIKPL